MTNKIKYTVSKLAQKLKPKTKPVRAESKSILSLDSLVLLKNISHDKYNMNSPVNEINGLFPHALVKLEVTS